MTSSVGPRLRSPRNRPPRRCVACWAVGRALGAVPIPLLTGILWIAIPPARFVFGPLFLSFLILGLLSVTVVPLWRYQVHRWEITDEAVYAVSGWLWQRWRIIPLSRVETVETARGPVQRALGLVDLTFSTPAHPGTVRISCLDEDEVDRIAARLPTLLRSDDGDGGR